MSAVQELDNQPEIHGYTEIIKEIVQKVKESGECFTLRLNPVDLETVLLALLITDLTDPSLLSDIISQFDSGHDPVVE